MALKKCVDLSNIDISCEDLDNMGGITPTLIYGYWEDVASWPDFPKPVGDTPITLEQAGTLTGDVVMKEGTCAYQFDFTDDTGEFKISDQGEAGGESYLYDLTIIAAKMRKKIFGFENATKGRRMFFIPSDNNGTRYLMGDKVNSAKKVSGDGSTTGTTSETRNQNSLHYTYSCPRKLVYEGDTENLLKIAPSNP